MAIKTKNEMKHRETKTSRDIKQKEGHLQRAIDVQLSCEVVHLKRHLP